MDTVNFANTMSDPPESGRYEDQEKGVRTADRVARRPQWLLRGLGRKMIAQGGAGEDFVGFHPESENRAKEEQADAAEKRQFPVTGFVDDEPKDKRGKDGREGRAGIHEPAGRSGKSGSDVHGDCPHRADGELGKEKAKAKENCGQGEAV